MPEEWFVRVLGKEYGPVDLETLREWKAEGRLIPENELRARDEERWIKAAEVPELFGVEPATEENEGARAVFRRRSFGGILGESLRIYFRGFPFFFLLALLPAVPSFFVRATLRVPDVAKGETFTLPSGMWTALLALLALFLVWPFFLGGLQFGALAVAEGRALRLREIWRLAWQHWPRLARLSLFVYGNYFFWTALPLVALLLVAGAPSVFSLLIALFALALQVYMVGRLFINFMFWQQTSTISDLDGLEALRESRELARSRSDEPILQRPLWRGAILASLWLILLLVVSAFVELPFVLVQLKDVTNVEQAMAMTQQLANAPMLDVLSSLVHTILRPLLGIAFVVLYFDAKAAR